MKAKELLRLLQESSDTAEVKVENGEIVVIEPAQQDITERIKTFDDAVNWCKENGHSRLVLEYNACAFHSGAIVSKDIVAYLKLRITTCALNEGWEPKFDGVEEMYFPFYGHDEIRTEVLWKINSIYSRRMAFKTNELAIYAATHFRDIYADFCGCKKGGEQ